jgi:hypothetical protein
VYLFFAPQGKKEIHEEEKYHAAAGKRFREASLIDEEKQIK